MKRIAILGGTFNPIHLGHLVMAQTALEKMKLDQVVFVPSNIPPHKSSKSLISAEDRYNMVRSAVRGHRGLSVSDVEIKRKGKSYSIDTVREFSAKGTKLFFILGQDAFDGLKDWKRIGELEDLVEFIVLNRPGSKKRRSRFKHHFIVMPNIEIASSDLRRMLANGQSVRYLVPDRVLKYISRRKLYQ